MKISFFFAVGKFICVYYGNTHFLPKEELFDEQITSNTKSLPTFFGEIGKIHDKIHYIVSFKQDKCSHTFIS